MGTACSDCYTTLIINGTSKIDTFNFYSKIAGDPTLTTRLLSTTPTYTIQNTRCLNSEESAMATGFLAKYSTVVDLSCPFCIGSTSFYMWSRHTPFMKDAPSSSSMNNVLTCVDIKKAMDDFKADQATYAYSDATNHPLSEFTITNYLNKKFNKKYTQGDYLKLMDGCAITDQVSLKKLIAGYRVELNSESDAEGLINTMNNYGTYKPDYLRFKTSTARPVLFIDFNSIAEDTLLAYKNLLEGTAGISLSGVYSRNYNYSQAFDDASLLFTSASCSFTPSTFTTDYSTVDASVWEAGAYNNNYKLHTIRAASGSTSKQQADLIADVMNYLHVTTEVSSPTCNSGYHYFGRDMMRSLDYNTTIKQEYLSYVYSLSSYSHDAVITAIDPAILGAHLPSFSSGTYTYENPYCSGNKSNLYFYTPSPSPLPSGYDLAKNTILNAVGATIFPENKFKYITALGSRLAIIQKAGGEYWYRYFDVNNKMYNLYITPPDETYAILPKDYTFSLSSMRMGPHPNTFYIDVTKGSTTVRCNGRADFTLGNSLVAENILLEKNAAEENCVDSLDCEYQMLQTARINGRTAYKYYFDSMVNKISNDMLVHLINTTTDSLQYCGEQQQYQQTLYYYDLAGNLTRTIPPAGVSEIAAPDLPTVVTNRNGASPDTKMTSHKKVSVYTYNSLNQLKYQYTPDGGTVYYFYDAAGRQIFSQNSKQRPLGMYSYSLYDEQGRPAESGEVKLGCTYATPISDFDTTHCTFYLSGGGTINAAHPHFITNAFDENTYSYADLIGFVRGKERKEVVMTFYDEQTQDLGAVSTEMLSTQDNLRSRVAAIKYYGTLAPSPAALPVNAVFSNYYSYDISGNVSTITYDFPQLNAFDQRYKRVDYDYDLISGKVNMISYNRGHPDQFYQKYDYDADNRIVCAKTSNDGLIWNTDATYNYYKHGPLAQTKIGNQKVQSLEYAYTIQGWLKSINGDVLDPTKDMGKNGISLATSPMPAFSDPCYPRDVVSHALHYFKNDYSQIGSVPVVNVTAGNKNLYNGNIVQQTTGIGGLGTMQRTYQYDQLQRLVGATNKNIDNATAAAITTPAELFRTAYSYDPDGNIKSLKRWDGSATPVQIDNFTYNYDALAVNNNKLLQVTDAASTTTGSDLQPGQTEYNYGYDKIGNLIRDKQGRELITWDRFGKVTSIVDSVSYRTINFGYDGKGNRIWKQVINPGYSGDNYEGEYYVRDAGGNILSVYRTHSVYSRMIFTKSVIDLSSAVASPVVPGGTVLTDVLIGLADRSYPSELKTLMLGSHSSWVTTYTSKPVSFFMAADPTLKSNLLYSGDAWINGLRTANSSVHTNAFLNSGMGAMPLFTAALNLNTEGKKMLQQYSTTMPVPVCQTIWSMVAAQFVPGNHAVNATNLYNGLSANPQMKPVVINQLTTELVNNFGSALPNAGNFYNAVVADNTLWNAAPLRGMNGSWTNTIRSVINTHGDNTALATFFDGWSGSTAALNACTTPDYKLTAVYNSDPSTSIVDMSAEAGNVEIANIIGTMTDLTMHEFGAKIVLAGLADADVRAELMKATAGDTMSLAEHHIYGSSRLGVQRYDSIGLSNVLLPVTGTEKRFLKKKISWCSFSFDDIVDSTEKVAVKSTVVNQNDSFTIYRTLGRRYYEINDHLGNVLATVLDRKTGSGTHSTDLTLYDHWSADLASTADYYPGGMMMPGRNTEYDWSRIGMQGQAKDDEVYGKGNVYAYKYRLNDARINRFFSPDPLHAKYPHNSDYAFAENRLIDGVELEGLEWADADGNPLGPVNEQLIDNPTTPLKGGISSGVVGNDLKEITILSPEKDKGSNFTVSARITAGGSLYANAKALGAGFAYKEVTAIGFKDNEFEFAANNYSTGDKKIMRSGYEGSLFLGGGREVLEKTDAKGIIQKLENDKIFSIGIGPIAYMIEELKNVNTGEVTRSHSIGIGFKAAAGIGIDLDAKYKLGEFDNTPEKE